MFAEYESDEAFAGTPAFPISEWSLEVRGLLPSIPDGSRGPGRKENTRVMLSAIAEAADKKRGFREFMDKVTFGEINARYRIGWGVIIGVAVAATAWELTARDGRDFRRLIHFIQKHPPFHK